MYCALRNALHDSFYRAVTHAPGSHIWVPMATASGQGNETSALLNFGIHPVTAMVSCRMRSTAATLACVVREAVERKVRLVWLPLSMNEGTMGHANGLWMDWRGAWPQAAAGARGQVRVVLFEPHGHPTRASGFFYDPVQWEALVRQLLTTAWAAVWPDADASQPTTAATTPLPPTLQFVPPRAYMPAAFGQEWAPRGDDWFCVAWLAAFFLGATLVGPEAWIDEVVGVHADLGGGGRTSRALLFRMYDAVVTHRRRTLELMQMAAALPSPLPPPLH